MAKTAMFDLLYVQVLGLSLPLKVTKLANGNIHDVA